MIGVNAFNRLRLRFARRKYSLFVALFITTIASPLAMPALAALASETINLHSISSTYTNPKMVTTANGSMWYVETDSSGNNDIGNMTTSGSVVDYAVMPSGDSYMIITGVTTGPDGNVWFDGCASTSSTSWTVEAGYLNVSTGAVTFYPNTTLGSVSCSPASGATPGPIATGPDGYVWYAVNGNSSGGTSYLFSVNTSTGITTTGWSISSSSNEFGGIAAGSDSRLWVTNNSTVSGNNVYALTVSSGSETADSSYSAGSEPSYIVNGPDGNLWFIVSGSNEIAKMTTSGTLTTYSLGSNVLPQALASGPDGAIWFTDSQQTGAIGRITTSGSVTEYTVSGAYDTPYYLTLGPDNSMWFSYRAASGSGYTYSIGSITTAPFFSEYSQTTGYQNASTIVSAGGSMWYLNTNGTSLAAISNITTSGAITNYNPFPSANGTIAPHNLAVDSSGNVWFAGCEDNSGIFSLTIGYINSSTGAITDYTESPHCSGLSSWQITALAVDASGNIWVAVHTGGPASGSTGVEEYNSSGTLLSSYSPSGSNLLWSSMIAGPSNSLWINEGYNHKIDQLTLSSTTGAVTGMNTYTPTGSLRGGNITVGPDGNLWFGESGAVGTMTPSGTFTNYSIASGDSPRDITTGPDGALWFAADPSSGATDGIGRITTGGSITEYSIPTSNATSVGITNGPDNAVWFTESTAKQIGRLGY